MKNYKEIVKEVITNTSIAKEDIFDFEDSPFKDEYNKTFEFYYETLLRNSFYGIEPCLLFFKNYCSINAAACYENGYYIVSINMGTIVGLINRFKEKTDLLISCDIDAYIEFEKLLDVPIRELMYQNATHFTFYHEMAHLIQKSNLLANTISENFDSDSGFSIESHLMELDADQFSSLCIGEHTLQYVKKTFGTNITNEKLEMTLIVICSSALFYILGFMTNKFDIYYKTKSHPHPIIRISCIVFHIVGYVTQSLNYDGFKTNTEMKEVVNKCLDFSNKLALKKFGENLIENYKETLRSEAINIIAYIKEMRELQEKDKTLASYKWNVIAKQLKNK